MNRRVRAYLDLIRLPNVVTAAADSLAGFLYVGGSIDKFADVALLMLASCCLYAGGVTLNDVCDVDCDRDAGRRRPIAVGAIARGQALLIAIALLAVGVGSASLVGVRAASVAVVIVIAVVLYDAALKKTAAAPAMMGVCRAANLALGMTIIPIEMSFGFWYPCLVMWLYVTSLTLLARHESQGASRLRAGVGVVGCVVATAGVGGIALLQEGFHVSSLWLAGALATPIAVRGYKAYLAGDAVSVQRAVKTCVVLLPLLDGALVAAQRGILTGLCVAMLIVPAAILARVFRVT